MKILYEQELLNYLKYTSCDIYVYVYVYFLFFNNILTNKSRIYIMKIPDTI